LGRIKSLTNFLKQGNEVNSEEVLDHLSGSVVNLEEMIVDLNQILMDKKKGQEAKSVINLPELIETIKGNLVDEIAESNAELLYTGNVLEIESIRSIWLSVLHNLISNSIKYRLLGKPLKIEIKCVANATDIELQVIDNGLGIDLELYRDKVFQLYNRFHSNQPGKGMGLYLVQSHVNMLNGTVNVYSQPNEGCTFIIRIPANA
jgi:signal transduction histidine kinase